MPFDQVLASTVNDLTAARDYLNQALERMPSSQVTPPLAPARQAILTAQQSIQQAVGMLIGLSWVALWQLTGDTRRPEDKA